MEVPAPVSGVLTVNVEAGATVDVGVVLAVIDDKSDAASPTTPRFSAQYHASAVSERRRPSLRLSPVVKKLNDGK